MFNHRPCNDPLTGSAWLDLGLAILTLAERLQLLRCIDIDNTVSPRANLDAK